MERIVLIFTLAMASTLLAAEHKLPIENTYIPSSFDSNDDITLVVTANTKNSCEFHPEVKVEKDLQSHQVLLGFTVKSSQKDCLDVSEKFSETIELGRMPVGKFEIIDASTGKKQGILNVKAKNHARPGPDAYPYAPVDNVKIHYDREREKWAISLSGTFDYPCDGIKDVILKRTENHVIELSPIRYDEKYLKCKEKKTPFNHSVGIDELKEGNYLVHVRTPNGGSLNRLVEVK